MFIFSKLVNLLIIARYYSHYIKFSKQSHRIHLLALTVRKDIITALSLAASYVPTRNGFKPLVDQRQLSSTALSCKELL